MAGAVTRQPCGTNAAYQWHIEHGEKACDRCRAAHTAYGRDRRAGVVRPRKTAACGTQEGYMHHRHSKTPICEPCREAHAAYNRAWRAERKRAAAERAAALEAAWAEVVAETVGAA